LVADGQSATEILPGQRSAWAKNYYPNLVGKARCAVRAAAERRNQMRENAGFRLLNAAGDIAARCPCYPHQATAKNQVVVQDRFNLKLET